MNSEKLYSLFAKFYDLLILRLLGYELAADYFIKQLPYHTDDAIEVLDAGAGTGLYSLAILKRFPNAKIIAFDLNEKMLEKMKDKLKKKGLEGSVKIFKADILLPIPELNRQFDLIITGGVLEHIDIVKAVKNLSQYLKTGGYFLNVGVRKNIVGKIIGSFWGLKIFSKEVVINAYSINSFTLLKYMTLPVRYFLIRLAKEVYIFQKL